MIELLVVIAIIAILASLLQAGLSKAKQTAYRAQCQSNQRELQLIWHLYADDNNGNYSSSSGQPGDIWKLQVAPFAGAMAYETPNNVGGVPASRFWESTNLDLLYLDGPSRVSRYVKNARIYKCPGDKSYVLIGGKRLPRVRSYEVCSFVGATTYRPAATTGYDSVMNLSDPFSPSGSYCFVEPNDDFISGPYHYAELISTELDHETVLISFDPMSNRHGGGANLSFLDEHVEHRRWRGNIWPKLSVVRGITAENASAAGGLVSDPDIAWALRRIAHTTVRRGN